MHDLPKKRPEGVEVDVSVEQGTIHVNSVECVGGSLWFKVFVIDCRAKRPEADLCTGDGELLVYLTAGEETLRAEDTPKPTIVTIKTGKEHWSSMIDAGRYAVRVITWAEEDFKTLWVDKDLAKDQ